LLYIGIKDGRVIGGEPEYYDDYEQIPLDNPNEAESTDWLSAKK